jgi:hypothetical protein
LLFIEFHIAEKKHFDDLKGLYKTFAEANYHEKAKPLSYWLSATPDYIKAHYNTVAFEDSAYDQAKTNFEQIIDYLQRDLEVDYEGLYPLTESSGRLDFTARAFPYGGLDSLIYYLSYFGCAAYRINAGFGPKTVTWRTDGDFDCTDETD